ncbi:peptidoglycan DD-metalloendopeptidase family protein [uncultured Sphingomonas sp.]|uniref:peptidoglycan DD-metalloendopeptidase family protein n=1 Tax=uncultured Sphingomonas sp. TaxID=158754 RepID=UPI0035CC4076
MRLAGPVSLGALLLAGCIPQSDPPPRDRPVYPGAAPWPYDHGGRPPPAPAPRDAAQHTDEVAEANRRSLDETQPSARPVPPVDDDRPPEQDQPAATMVEPQPQPFRAPTQRTRPPPPPIEPAAGAPVDASAPAPPIARPAWEARPVVADAVEVTDGSYTVHPGESLRAAAEATGVGVEALARANDLTAPYPVRAGQRLRVPGGRYHLVRPGQSGIAIARAYGVAWSRIVDANGLAEPYSLHVGDRILIPGGGNRTTSAAERAAAFNLDVDDILTGGEPALAVNQAPTRPIATATRVLPPSAAISAPARLRGGFVWPADGKLVKRFGRGESGYRNDGIEIAVPVETAVHVAADGVVAYAGEGIAALGGIVIVRHGDGWTTVYGHASKLLVQRGQSVRRGQTIALSGDTGFADRPELHFELRKGRAPVDPLAQLPDR